MRGIPYFCDKACKHLEIISIQNEGDVIGCVQSYDNEQGQWWRRLDKMFRCPQNTPARQ